MKYETLYNLTMEQGGVTVRVEDYPEKIVMPTKGFAVGNSGDAFVFHPKSRDDEDARETFDTLVEKQLRFAEQVGTQYIGTWYNTDDDSIHIDLVDVFASKDFALGVAFGRGELAIFDLTNKREIRLRGRKW